MLRNNITVVAHQFLYKCVCAQSCLTLYNLMGYSPPRLSVHGIFQARILEQLAMSYSSGFFQSTVSQGNSLQATPQCL